MKASNCGLLLAFWAEAAPVAAPLGTGSSSPPFFFLLPLSWGVSTPCFTASGTPLLPYSIQEALSEDANLQTCQTSKPKLIAQCYAACIACTCNDAPSSMDTVLVLQGVCSVLTVVG